MRLATTLTLLCAALSGAAPAFAQVPHGSPTQAVPPPAPAPLILPYAAARPESPCDLNCRYRAFYADPSHFDPGTATSPFAFLDPAWDTLSDLDKAKRIRLLLQTTTEAWRDIYGNLPPPHYLAAGMHPTDRKIINDLLLFQQEKRWRTELAQLLMLILQSERTVAFLKDPPPGFREQIKIDFRINHKPDTDVAVTAELQDRIEKETALLAHRRVLFALKHQEWADFQAGNDGAPIQTPASSLIGNQSTPQQGEQP